MRGWLLVVVGISRMVWRWRSLSVSYKVLLRSFRCVRYLTASRRVSSMKVKPCSSRNRFSVYSRTFRQHMHVMTQSDNVLEHVSPSRLALGYGTLIGSKRD